MKDKRSRIRVVQMDNLRRFLGIRGMDKVPNASLYLYICAAFYSFLDLNNKLNKNMEILLNFLSGGRRWVKLIGLPYDS